MSGRSAKPAGGIDDRWTLRAAGRALLGKSGAMRLGFAVPLAAVEAIAAQVGVADAASGRNGSGLNRHATRRG